MCLRKSYAHSPLIAHHQQEQVCMLEFAELCFALASSACSVLRFSACSVGIKGEMKMNETVYSVFMELFSF